MRENSVSSKDVADTTVDSVALVMQRTTDRGNVGTQNHRGALVKRKNDLLRLAQKSAEEACLWMWHCSLSELMVSPMYPAESKESVVLR